MTRNIEFLSGGKKIAAEIFEPAKMPSRGAIVIAYGSDGFVDNEHGPWKTTIYGFASDLAGEGFTVIIPDYFQRTNTRPGDIDFRNGGAQQIWLHRDEWQATLADALKHAAGLAGGTPARLGLLGFSLGGYLCSKIRAGAGGLVEFFAPALDGIGPSGGSSLHAQIHHGLGDTLVPFALNAPRIEQELRTSGATTELCKYEGATHGFASADPADVKARQLSKERTVAFFAAHL